MAGKIWHEPPLFIVITSIAVSRRDEDYDEKFSPEEDCRLGPSSANSTALAVTLCVVWHHPCWKINFPTAAFIVDGTSEGTSSYSYNNIGQVQQDSPPSTRPRREFLTAHCAKSNLERHFNRDRVLSEPSLDTMWYTAFANSASTF